MNKSSSTKYHPVDLYASIDPETTEEKIIYLTEGRPPQQGSQWPIFCRQEYLVWSFLAIEGVMFGFLAFGVDQCVGQLYILQEYLTSTQYSALNYAVWVIFSVFFCLLAHAIIISISPQAAGSGIPEMKSILSGISNDTYMSIRTVLSKILSLISAFAGGLSIGKEGPFVHLSACLAHHLMRIPPFRMLRGDELLKMQLIAAGCAVGVVGSFGAPVGGVLFSIEVTSTFFFVDNIWKACFSAVCGFVVVNLVPGWGGMIELFHSKTDPLNYSTSELLFFAAIGVCGGIISALWIFLLAQIISIGRKSHFSLPRPWDGFAKVAVVGLVISLFTYEFEYFRNDSSDTVDMLVSDEPIKELQDWGYIIGLFFFKFIVTLFSVGFCQVSAGLYTPIFVTGCVLGRILGELMVLWLPHLDIHQSVYAIIGAAALSAGVTQTISTAVIVVELTGQISLLLPILVSQHRISPRYADWREPLLFGTSAYDVMIMAKGLPCMPPHSRQKKLNLSAGEIMRTDLHFLSLDSTFLDAAVLLQNTNHYSLPVVESKETMVFLGSVTRGNIISVLGSAGIPAPVRVSGVQKNVGIINVKSRKVSGSHTSATEDHLKEGHSGEGNEEGAGADPSCDSIETIGSERSSSRKSETVEVGGISIPISITEREMEQMEDLPEDSPYRVVVRQLHMQLPFIFPERSSSTSSTSNPNLSGVAVIDTTCFHLDKEQSVYRVYFMFAMLGLPHAFVTSKSRLVGVITKRDLLRWTGTTQFDH